MSITLKYQFTDTGYCRVMYRHNKRLYCWQEEAAGQFVFYNCTDDEEPIGEVRADMTQVSFERPDGGTQMDADFIKYAEQNNIQLTEK